MDSNVNCKRLGGRAEGSKGGVGGGWGGKGWVRGKEEAEANTKLRLAKCPPLLLSRMTEMCIRRRLAAMQF